MDYQQPPKHPNVALYIQEETTQSCIPEQWGDVIVVLDRECQPWLVMNKRGQVCNYRGASDCLRPDPELGRLVHKSLTGDGNATKKR